MSDYNRNIWSNQLKGREVSFGSWFQKTTRSLGSIAFDLWSGKPSWQERVEEDVCSPHRSQEAKRETGHAVPISPLRTCPQWPSFLPLDPTFYWFHHFPIAPQAGDYTLNIWHLWGTLNLTTAETSHPLPWQEWDQESRKTKELPLKLVLSSASEIIMKITLLFSIYITLDVLRILL
jgi:hypothetical protein